MALTPGRVHAGGARIFAGVTAGTTGTPPTYIGHTAGVPASGTEMGLTDGETKFKYQAVKELITAEQSLAPIDAFVTEELATLEFTCQEQTYAALQRAFDNVGSEDISAGEAFYFGGGSAILAPRLETIMVTSLQRNATKYVITVFYRAVYMSGIEMPFSRTGRSMYSVTVVGLADLTRDAGDQVGYHRFETAA